ncbi:aldehyde dehydrogenase family protein [Synechococcus sp. PCC 7336]|uniref:aldehyde dehydrogenase family protein n=1 Tax=Synechococcus sp. PCC 7336 TaxID=195250 RepID=UPI00034D21DD|nr:aldehyde dehydrogenase family protein [Synechococcus sp. PCC 7336]
MQVVTPHTQVQERLLWIGGRKRAGVEIREVTNPFDGSLVARVHFGDGALLDEAIAVAHQTFVETWKATPAHKRADILSRAAQLIEARQELLARTIAEEVGKPIVTARGEASRAVKTFKEAAHICLELRGEQIPMDIVPNGEGKFAVTLHQPLGVVGGITPFNFPLNLVAHKVAPALAAGNTVVLKPPSDGPSAALLLADILAEAGLPDGCLNVVPCGGAVAERLATDPRIQVLTFTGSADVGWHLRSLAKEKKVMLELGSMSPAIVHSDADLTLAVDRCVFGGFAFAGQVCIHTQRILIHASIYEKFKRRFIDKVAALVVGDPLNDRTFVGPMVGAAERDRVHQWVSEARAAGATVPIGGKPHADFPSCYLPTVLENLPADTTIACSEVFGPVVALQPYDSFDEAIALANNSPYSGLNAGVFTNDYRLALKAGRELTPGTVLINNSPTWRVDHMPYGGRGKSGSGREGPRYAIEEMTEIKLIVFEL